MAADLLVAGGTVVTATDVVPADVVVTGETITAVVAPGTGGDAAEVVDATGRWVIPGAVDVHTHMELPMRGRGGKPVVACDDFTTGTRAALFGGTTTIVDYAGQRRGGTLAEGLAGWQERAAERACGDYGFHLMVTDVTADTLGEIPALVAAGVSSFKLFTAYPGSNYSDDGQILRTMQAAADAGATIMMHAENGIAIDVLRAQALARGDTAPVHHLLTRPASLEAEAVHRVVLLAEVAGCPLVIVHISSADAMAEAVAAADRGLPVVAETCPQYLVLALEDLPDGFEAARFVCSPPLRRRSDGHQDRLWAAVASGRAQVVATDHCPFTLEQKALGRGDFTAIPNGIGTVEHRLDLLHTAVAQGRLSPTRWVDACCTAPARVAGLHPRKGAIAPGADADLVIYDPAARHRLSVATHHSAVDHSVYEGVEVTGRTETVLLRGRVVIRDGVHVGRPGDGRYLPRGPNTLTTPTAATPTAATPT